MWFRKSRVRIPHAAPELSLSRRFTSCNGQGFGKRYGMRLTGVSVSNAMEASMSAIWGKDPRYRRSKSESFKGRIRHVVKMTFLAENRQGQMMPAYARYIAISGSNFISIAGQRGDGGKCIFPHVARLRRTDEQQRLSGVLAGCSPSIFPPTIGTKVLPTTKNLPISNCRLDY